MLFTSLLCAFRVVAGGAMRAFDMRGVLLVLGVLGALAACASLHGREDLDERLFLHHNNLRWGRLGNAATHVAPELRESFLSSWGARSAAIELQDVEVTAVTLAPDGATADVLVAFVWVDRESMSVKQGVASELWRRTSSGWVLERPAELPPG